jgi:hypothetical protein
MMTFDESWFSLNMDHAMIWLQLDEEIPERERHTVQYEKVMTMIIWNPSGFHLIKLLPKRFKFNASYDIIQILDPVSVWRGTQIGRTNRKFIVHAANARPHTAKVTWDFMERNAMKRPPHPPDSLNLALSDFYLLTHVEQLLSGYKFADREALLHAIKGILKGIEK